jgi:integrase
MGYVQEYAPGRFRGRKRIDGKLVSKSFTSRSDAYAWADDDAVSDTPSLPVRAANSAPRGLQIVTLGQFLDGGGFVDSNNRESTRAQTESLIRAHIRPRFGDTLITEITHLDVQRWITTLHTKDRSPRTVLHIKKKMQGLMDAAMRAGLIAVNPVVGVVTPRIDEEEMRFLNTDQVVALSDNIHDDFKAWVPLCAYGGLRIGESFGLRWSRVDLFSGTIDIAEIATEVKGHTVLGAPKTRAGRRVVSIPRVAVHAIRDHQTAIGGTPDPSAFVFGDGTRPVSQRSFRRWRFGPAATKSKLGGLRPHDLRHTAVALWIAAGASPKEVAARAGHTSVSFTLDRYGHLFPSMDKKLITSLDRVIKNGVK